MKTKNLSNLKSDSKIIIVFILTFILCAFTTFLQSDDADTILDKTKIRNGICLILSDDLTLTKSLASKSNLYLHVLQKDHQKALAWGAEIAKTTNPDREKISVLHAELKTENYATNLFNLIIIENQSYINNTKLSDLNRILVPNGVLLCRQASTEYTKEAKLLEMNSLEIPSFSCALKKNLKPIEWLPCDSLKWRAGMRAHMAYGIGGATHGAGRFFYREKLESANGWPNDTSQLVARDDFNGRVLWCKQEEVPWTQWNMVWPIENWDLAADNAGRLFTVTKEGKFVCLDGATGELKFELIATGARPSRIDTFNDKYVFYANTVFSAETGKTLWKWQGKTTTCFEETMLVADDNTLRAHNLADGKELFKVNLDWRVSLQRKDMDLMHLGNQIIIADGGPYARPFQVTALNPTNGEKLWTTQLGGIFALPPQGEKGKSFGGTVRYVKMGDKLLAFTHTQYFYDTHESQKEVHFTSIDLATGKIEKEDYGNKNRVSGSACGTDKAIALGDYLTYHHNVWLNYKTLERTFPYLIHPACSLPPTAQSGMMYNSPGRKGGHIQGITAITASDIKFDQTPGGKTLIRYASQPAFNEPTKATDWPIFRGNNARGNAINGTINENLKLAWVAKLTNTEKPFGQMYSERCGLTQAVIAYQLAIVVDIWSQRVVALDLLSGKEQWVYHLGSRADFSPTIYKGLCIIASKDGYVHCISAKNGSAVYKLLIAPSERQIGGHEKLESLWPCATDVFVDKDGIGHISAGFATTVHGGIREVTFKVETGEVVESKVKFEPFDEPGCNGKKPTFYTEPLSGGFQLTMHPDEAMDDMLGYGNSISRNNEDRAAAIFKDKPNKSRASGKVIAFDDLSCVAHVVGGGEAWALKSPMNLMASNLDAKTPLWRTEPIELIADDILLTPKNVFVVGHYRRVQGSPEIWVLSREDGKVLTKIPVDGFPAYLGMSASENRLLVATRDGKLICYQSN